MQRIDGGGLASQLNTSLHLLIASLPQALSYMYDAHTITRFYAPTKAAKTAAPVSTAVRRTPTVDLLQYA